MTDWKLTAAFEKQFSHMKTQQHIQLCCISTVVLRDSDVWVRCNGRLKVVPESSVLFCLYRMQVTQYTFLPMVSHYSTDYNVPRKVALGQ